MHIVTGRYWWMASIKPYDKEVVLAKGTLMPMGEGRQFPGFNEDGLITIGYSHLVPTPGDDKPRMDLVVLWMTAFKVTDEEANGLQTISSCRLGRGARSLQ